MYFSVSNSSEIMRLEKLKPVVTLKSLRNTKAKFDCLYLAKK